jgi:hypothetical protein
MTRFPPVFCGSLCHHIVIKIVGSGAEAAKFRTREKVAAWGGRAVRDMEAHLEKLLRDAAECELISRLATDVAKRDLFNHLAVHLKMLADEVERAMGQKISRDASC